MKQIMLMILLGFAVNSFAEQSAVNPAEQALCLGCDVMEPLGAEKRKYQVAAKQAETLSIHPSSKSQFESKSHSIVEGSFKTVRRHQAKSMDMSDFPGNIPALTVYALVFLSWCWFVAKRL